MERPRPSTLAWMGLASYVVTYDVLCKRGETLSEGVDAALEHPVKKVLALGAIALTTAHLCNLIPDNLDPFARMLSFKDKVGETIDDAMDCFGDD